MFVAVTINFLLLGIGYIHHDSSMEPNQPVIKASRFFGLLAAFQAWYITFIGLVNDVNSFLVLPMFWMPWVEGIQNEKGNWKAKEVQRV